MLAVGFLTEMLMWLPEPSLGQVLLVLSILGVSWDSALCGGHCSNGCSGPGLITAGIVDYEGGGRIGGMSPESEVGQ